jgi:hypothetical protein
MSEVTYFNGWKPELCLKLKTTVNVNADFNRFLVKGVPSTVELQRGGIFENADRKRVVLKLKLRFSEKIEEGGSHGTIYSLFRLATDYLRWCDKHNVQAFTQYSLEGYLSHKDNQVMLGDIKSTSYVNIRATTNTLFTKYLELPYSYFDNVIVRDKSDSEPFEAYTRSDLNLLLPFLRQLFKQSYTQFMAEPEKHLSAYQNVATMTFLWKGHEYKLSAGITKMMCAGLFLLAYYTYSNTTSLLKLKHPENAAMTLGEVWYTMPTFKRRAFKTIQVEMGGHELEIPKYSLDFFNNLLTASKRINHNEKATLFQTTTSKKVRPISESLLSGFLSSWVEKHFTFIDQTGRRLRPIVSRFRATGAQITAYYQGDIANNVMLNNTPDIRKRHYNKGNEITNKGMLQDAMAIREEQIKSKVNTKQARENLKIEVLVIDAEYKINIPNLSKTINGGSCGDPFGDRSDKYTKQAQSRGLAREGERLACADLLACFGCPHQVIVQSVPDIWCLLSFKACIEESLYLHLDANHYRNNFEAVIKFIEQKILPNINNIILKKALTKLNYDGYHPTWNDHEAVLMLISEVRSEVN